MAVTMNKAVFWDVTPCGSYENRRLVYSDSMKTSSPTQCLPFAFLFNLHDGYSILLRNRGKLLPVYTAPYSRRHFSCYLI
jgi:hypothetical protein